MCGDIPQESELERIAREKAESLTSSREVGWPDCYDVSMAIKSELAEEYDVPEEKMEVQEFVPVDGFRHYALVVMDRMINKSAVIDAYFAQFDSGTETPINFDWVDDVVVVSPEHSYIFV